MTGADMHAVLRWIRAMTQKGSHMTNIEIKRDHTGKLHMYVAGVPALGVNVSAVSMVEGKLCAIAYVPLDIVTLGEVNTVIPMRISA
jgi:hypothetical protein